MNRRLQREFFARPTLDVARDLLGKRIARIDGDGGPLTGFITETEAYITGEDLACHAKSGRTRRNQSLWGPPGHAYVYFTYGMHWLLNFVTEADGFPAAVLIRGMFPERGIETMQRRRGNAPLSRLADGPAKLCQALDIDGRFDGADLCRPDSPLYLESRPRIPEIGIHRGPRIGINSVPEPWKSIPWRFWIEGATLSVGGEIE